MRLCSASGAGRGPNFRRRYRPGFTPNEFEISLDPKYHRAPTPAGHCEMTSIVGRSCSTRSLPSKPFGTSGRFDPVIARSQKNLPN